MALIAREFTIQFTALFIFVSNFLSSYLTFIVSTVLAGATKESIAFPGPPITGYKASGIFILIRSSWTEHIHQGDNFAINVIDELTDTTMFRSTSIVSGRYTRSTDFLNMGMIIIALARNFPRKDQLCGWSCWSLSMPNYPGKFVFVSILCPRSGRNLLVPLTS